MIPIAIDKIEQDGANDAEERQQGRVLNLQSEHAHADVIEVLLHPNNGLPYLNGELLAVVIVHGRL